MQESCDGRPVDGNDEEQIDRQIDDQMQSAVVESSVDSVRSTELLISSGASDDGVTVLSVSSSEPVACMAATEQTKGSIHSPQLFPRMICFLVILLAMTYAAPTLIEEVSYRVNKGKQRGEYEVATEGLRNARLTELSQYYQLISNRVGPSVVHINTNTASPKRSGQFGPLMNSFPSRGQGSGVVVDQSGYIMTNRHVIEDSNEISVKLSDGRRVPAEIVGVDKLTDLALLKVEASDLIPVEFADSDSIDEGAFVWAIGSPFGLERSITFGIVSAKHRKTRIGRVHQDFLQTDAAVNPGNSGGPLVDAEGRLVGINTAIVGDTYQGISFAVPSNVVADVFDRIRSDGRVRRGWLGVELRDVDDEDIEDLKLTELKGALVVEYADYSPARKAGLLIDDVIVGLNETTVADTAELIRAIGRTKIGTVAALHVLRQGDDLTIRVEIAERPLNQ